MVAVGVWIAVWFEWEAEPLWRAAVFAVVVGVAAARLRVARVLVDVEDLRRDRRVLVRAFENVPSVRLVAAVYGKRVWSSITACSVLRSVAGVLGLTLL